MRESKTGTTAMFVVLALTALTLEGCKRDAENVTQNEPGHNFENAIHGRDLDPSTRPLLELSRFKDVECTSVSEYFTDFKGAFAVVRVHRFTYKANYEEELELWRMIFPESDGWLIERNRSNVFINSKDYKDGKVPSHAMILEPGTYKRNEDVLAKTEKVEDYDYVRVAMNEFHWAEQKEPLVTIAAFTESHDKNVEVPVPAYAYIESWTQSAETFTFEFSDELNTAASSYHALELWLRKDDETYVAIINLSVTLPDYPGIKSMGSSEARLLDRESVIDHLQVKIVGKSITVTMPGSDWEPCVAISRWAPVEVLGFIAPEIFHVRVSSIEMAPDRQPFANPHLWRFYQPIIDSLK